LVTSFIVNDDLVPVDFAIVSTLIGSDEVIPIIKLDEGVAARLTLLITDHPNVFDDAVLLDGENLTSNSYLRVFSVVL
jgi:hypothetical protein